MRILVSILLIVLLFSCTGKKSPPEQIRQLNNTDTFYFEFPKVNGVIDSFHYKKWHGIQNEYGLTFIEEGFDSIQIRLLYGGPMVGERFVVLTNKNNRWNAEVSKLIAQPDSMFKGSWNASYSEKYILTRAIDYKTPKSGWKKFIRKLFDHDILILPDGESLADFKGDFSDGVGVTIEIATKNVYRMYSLGNPDEYMEEYKEMRKVSQIIKLVDEELGLKKLWDYMNETPDPND